MGHQVVRGTEEQMPVFGIDHGSFEHASHEAGRHARDIEREAGDCPVFFPCHD